MVDAQDFSTARLRSLFRLSLSEGFHPIFFGDEDRQTGRFVLWRHDVDLDLADARALARVEAEEGIRSTYFLMIRSYFYNLFSRDGEETVAELRALGHRVGLHCDLGLPRDAAAAADVIERTVARDFRLVDTYFGDAAFDRVVSFHNPPMAVLRRSFSFYSTYQERFFGAIKYMSDSNRHFREGPPESWLESAKAPALSILLHPVLWALPGRTMPEGAKAFVDRRRDELLVRLEQDDVHVR